MESWFSVTALKEIRINSHEFKDTFNRVINEITTAKQRMYHKKFIKDINEITTAKQRMYHKKFIKDIPGNNITKRVHWDFDYSKRVEALLRLESLHIEQQACNQLMQMAYCRASDIHKEICDIKNKFIEPEYVDCFVCSFPKRSYKIRGKEYTTYDGRPIINNSLWVAIGTAVVAYSFLA
jgi:hypothetical protein